MLWLNKCGESVLVERSLTGIVVTITGISVLMVGSLMGMLVMFTKCTSGRQFLMSGVSVLTYSG